MNASLDILEEKKDDFQVKLATYQNWTKIYFNSKTRKKYFKVGKLILKKVFVVDKEMSSSSPDQKC